MLKIQCPSCSSQFKVGEEFLGKYVECGSCEYQFTVAETHINEGSRKGHLPVHKHSDLSGFTKTFDQTAGLSEPTTSQEQHLSKLKQDDFMPMPLWKQAMNILAWGLAALGAALLILGSVKNSFLMDAGYDKRFIIAGFIVVVSALCFFLGTRHAKNAFGKSLLVAVVMCALAYFLPMYNSPFKEASGGVINASPSAVEPVTVDAATLENEYPTVEKLMEVCRYSPVEEAVLRAQARGDTSAKSVGAVWIQGSLPEQQYAIQDYFKDALGLTSRPSYFRRKTGALVLMEGISGYTIQDLAEIASVFGDMDDFYQKERLISISYNKDLFKPLDSSRTSALSEFEGSEFYTLNIQEALHFDSRRVLASVKRLDGVEPRYKADVINALKTVLERFQDPKITDAACSCLQHWAADDIKSYGEFLDGIARYEKRGTVSSKWAPKLVEILLVSGSPKINSIVLELWKENPTEWETVMINSGVDFNQQIVSLVDLSNRGLCASVINILSKSQSPSAQSYLQGLRNRLGESYHSSIDRALD